MAIINITALLDANGGATQTGATGSITFTAEFLNMPATRVNGELITMPEPVVVEFVDGVAAAEVDLDVLPVNYYWHAHVDINLWTADYWFIIPADSEYDFGDLTFIDRTDLSPLPLTTVQVPFVQFDTTTLETPDTAGKLLWNATEHTLDLATGQGGVVVQLGQEFVQYCHNSSGSAIAEGKVVKVVGSTGQKLDIELASNDSEMDSSATFGVVTHSGGIANGGAGFVTIMGKVRGLNTNGYEEGDALWLGTNGNITNVKPTQPAHLVHIGWVVVKSANGTIFVKVQNGFELNEIHNVFISDPQDGDVLTYQASTGLWINA